MQIHCSYYLIKNARTGKLHARACACLVCNEKYFKQQEEYSR